MFKRGASAVQEEDEERWISRMRNIIREENQTLVDSFEKRFVVIESRQDQLQSRIEELERKLGRSPGSGGGPSAAFQPQFLEIKGFCEWGKRLEKGATREDAAELMNLLMPTLPTSLHGYIKPFQLRGIRNYSIQAPIDSTVIREVKGIWTDAFKQGIVHGPDDAELYATLQKSPEQKVRYSAMGKLYEFAKSAHVKAEGGLKAFWAPGFCVYRVPAQGQAVLVANLNPDNSVAWSAECQTFLGCSAEEASSKFSGFSGMHELFGALTSFAL